MSKDAEFRFVRLCDHLEGWTQICVDYIESYCLSPNKEFVFVRMLSGRCQIFPERAFFKQTGLKP